MQLALAGQSGADPANWQPRGLAKVDVPGLYLHVPFCFHKCHYCDFYSITQQSPQRMERFVDLVLSEGRGWTGGARGPRPGPTTIFFGGGTPSLLPLADMRRLLRGLHELLDLSQVVEWTIECNPATVDEEYCRMLRESGVNRLSFGAQSFDEKELALLERHHQPEDVHRSIEIARRAGFERLSIDLIYAIPGQTLESWEKSLAAGLALGTEHLSCYGLTYESNTPFTVRRRLGQFEAAEESLELRMLHRTRQTLAAAGLAAYEISNYARPGAECQHNLLYWNGGDYIGLGPSAASHVRGWRWKNRAHLGEWESAVERGDVPATETESLTPQQRAGELAMLQLRLDRGIEFEDFLRRTGVDARKQFAATIEQLTSVGLLARDDRGIRMTERGVDVADAIAGEFIG